VDARRRAATSEGSPIAATRAHPLARAIRIWIALAIFTISALREGRERNLAVEDPTAT